MGDLRNVECLAQIVRPSLSAPPTNASLVSSAAQKGPPTGDRGRTLARWLPYRFPKPQFDGVCKCQMRLAPSAPLVISCMRGPLGGFLMGASINRRCSWPLNTWILPRTDRIETGGVETPATYSSVRHAVNGPQSVHQAATTHSTTVTRRYLGRSGVTNATSGSQARQPGEGSIPVRVMGESRRPSYWCSVLAISPWCARLIIR